MARFDAAALDESLDAGDVSRAWLVWSCAVETALADAYRFAGGPVPAAGMRTVRLGGPLPVRRNAADAREGGEVHLYQDSSAAPLLDIRRRLKAVMDVLDVMIRDGFSFARSVELAVRCDGILGEGPIGPVTREDYQAAGRGGRKGGRESCRPVGDLYCRVSDFIHGVVVHRRDVAITAWRNWLREDPLVHPYKWLRPDLVPLAPFLQCQPHLTPGGSGVLADPAWIDEEFRKAWLPSFCRSG